MKYFLSSSNPVPLLNTVPKGSFFHRETFPNGLGRSSLHCLPSEGVGLIMLSQFGKIKPFNHFKDINLVKTWHGGGCRLRGEPLALRGSCHFSSLLASQLPTMPVRRMEGAC